MRKLIKWSLVIIIVIGFNQVYATDLVAVYQQAVVEDPTFQQALANEMIANEQEPQARALLLPQIQVIGTGSLTKQLIDGRTPISNNLIISRAETQSQRALGYNLQLTQTLFNF